MPTLRPFRDYNEKDVINLFAFGGTIPANKGTLVKVSGDGWKSDQEIEFLGSVGASYNNTVSERFGVTAKVAVTTAGERPLGLLLRDVREVDENGELLKFNPRKAAEMEAVLSGQAVPIVTKGMFHYSGEILSTQSPVGGTALYAGVSGQITTGVSGSSIGIALGAKDTDGVVLIRLSL